MISFQNSFTALLLTIIVFPNLKAQQNPPPGENHPRVFFSVGSHVGLWSLMGMKKVPLSLNLDYNLYKNEASYIGIGYTRDIYRISINSLRVRENYRVRLLYFEGSSADRFQQGGGFALGLSIWKNNEFVKTEAHGFLYNTFPSAQLIYCNKIKLIEGIVLLNEIALGPPYAFRSSISYEF